jgi:hypothetical protein
MFSMSTLRKRGWTTGLVRRFLGEAHAIDTKVEPPKRPRRLWGALAVYAAEVDPLFATAKEATKQRVAAATHARGSAFNAVIAVADAATISVPALPADFALEVRAIVTSHGVASFSDDAGRTLGWECLAVNWLLDRMAADLYVLDAYFGKPGVQEGRRRLRARQLREITKRFPELACASEPMLAMRDDD